MSTAEAARTLGLSERSIRRAIEDGRLGATKRGRAYHLDPADVARAAADRKRPPADRLAAGRRSVDDGPDGVAALPKPLSSLIGREQVVADVVALLADPAVRLATLTGPGGIGKTRLAIAAAAVCRQFPDGSAFVALDPVPRADLVLPAVAQALGLREQPGRSRAAQLQDLLRDRRFLLVLDNFEHLLDAGPDVVEVLTAAGQVTALVTSRAPLRVDGEREYPVPPLTQAADDAGAAGVLASGAGRLFVERARAHAPEFALDEASAPAIAEICARLDGLPLAIELAAARVGVMPPRQLLDRLEPRLPLLTRGARNAPPRHGTMRDAIAWSYDLIAPNQQSLFRRLAVFTGGFTLDAAEHVGAWPGDGDGASTAGPATALDTAENLLDQSLLVATEGIGGANRFRMLETIREFGLEQLAAAGETVEARRRHAQYVLWLARSQRAWVTTHARQAPLDRLAAEDANLQAALAWLSAEGPPAAFVELAAALAEYWYSLSLLHEGKRWLDRALGAVAHAAPPDQARLLAGAAAMSIGRARFDEAAPLLARALALGRAVGDPLDIAWMLVLLSGVHNGAGDFRAAEAVLHEALDIADRIDDPALAAAFSGRVLTNLSTTARGRGDGELAGDLGMRAIRRYAGHGLDLAESISCLDLGASACEAGDYPLAVDWWRRGLVLTGERGDMRQVADALSGIAGVAAAWAEHRPALLLYGAADALRERAGAAMIWPFDVAASERGLAALRAAVGEHLAAATLAEGRTLSLAEARSLAAGLRRPVAGTVAKGPRRGLTRREIEVLRLLATGQTDREIGDALFLSHRTVQWHVRSILAKLEASTRWDAVAAGRARGIV